MFLFILVLVLSFFLLVPAPLPGRILIGTAFLALFVFLYLTGTAQCVYKAALYLYSDGKKPLLFSEEEFSSAFAAKKNSR